MHAARRNDRYVAHATDAPSRVDFDGGIGTDVANYFFATTGVRVSVDLLAGDGRAGDDDRIRRNVETVFGSTFADVLAGGPHAEHLAGFDGDDQVTGGAGGDVLSGGPGDDRIDARDGEQDTIDCGGWGSTGLRSTSTARPPSPGAPMSRSKSRLSAAAAGKSLMLASP